MVDETCEHYDAQVAVTINKADPRIECVWCGSDGYVELIKDQREGIVFCEECRDVLVILSAGRVTDQ